MKMLRVWAIGCAAILLQGCASTHVVSMSYKPPQQFQPVSGTTPKVRLGIFVDKRGTDSRWVGAIRGGYGNVLKRLVTSEPTADVVQEAFRNALQARAVTVSSSPAAVSVEGEILKLDCSYFFNREAHAHLLVKVISTADNATIYSQIFKSDNREDGVGAGIFGNVEHLAAFEQKTVNETIDKVLADPAFLDALQLKSVKSAAQSLAPQDRLRSLERLKADGLITQEEFEIKRAEILKDL